MNCESYQNLHPLERSKLIGEVVHCLQNDEALFSFALELRELGHRKGLFEKVIIGHELNDESETN